MLFSRKIQGEKHPFLMLIQCILLLKLCTQTNYLSSSLFLNKPHKKQQMKSLLQILFLLVIACNANAQLSSGPGIVFDYDPAGFRVLRHYDPNASYLKPGQDNGLPADTIISIYKDQLDPEINDKEFVRAYPNPVKDILYIENLDWKHGYVAEVKLLDASGKQILSKSTELQKDQVYFNSVLPGSYQVQYYLNKKFLISWTIIKL